MARVNDRPVHLALPKLRNVPKHDENSSDGEELGLQERAVLSFSLSISFRKAIFSL